jgi:hypothetical protein
MRNILDIAKQAIKNNNQYKTLAGYCQYYIFLVLSVYLGYPAPGGYGSARLAMLASKIESYNPDIAPAGSIHYFDYVDSKGNNYGHVGVGLGNGLMASGTANTRGKVLDLGGGVLVSDVSEYATSRTYQGWSRASGNRPPITGVEAWAPANIPGPGTGRDGYSYQMVQGDGLVYQEPTGAFANRILRAMTNWCLDPKKNSTTDGKIGINTRKALQRFARAKGRYTGPIDGKLGKNSIKGLQRAGKAAGVYFDAVDGLPGFNTWTGVAKANGQ